jgi:cytoskeletal protein CcmA (bactofilin family)
MFDKEKPGNSAKDEVQEEVTPVKADANSEHPEFSARSVSYIGSGMQFSGEVTVSEGLVIEGTFDGNVTSTDENLTVGKKGRVTGELRGTTISLRGKVEGTIHAEDLVRLFSTAVVDGTVYCKRIIVDEGATLNGTVDMSADHSADAKPKLASVDTGDAVAEAAG